MLYPLYVHVGDDKHAHGVTFPDFPGCHAAADSWDELPAAVQEAAQAHFEGDDSPIPEPSALEDLTRDPEYTGGVWMIFDIDLSKINTKAVRFSERSWTQSAARLSGEVAWSNAMRVSSI
ncbi:type II toxin-antitoxin system HicB family antitoxin [Burkholderia glumae]